MSKRWKVVRTKREERITEPAEVNKSGREKRKMFTRIGSPTRKLDRDKRYDNATQHLRGYSKRDRETPCIYVHRRKNPAAKAARTTVTPDPVTEAAPFPDRLAAGLVPVEVGEVTTVLVLVTLEGLAGSEP